MNEKAFDPNEGWVGYLTWADFDRLRWAVTNAQKHMAWWRVAGHIRSRDPEERHTRQRGNPLPLPGPWLAAEEINRLLQELNRWADLEDAANDLDGEYFARLVIREVETACAKWPIDDRPHKVRFFRCLACGRQSLKYFPPKAGDREGIARVDVLGRIRNGTVRTKPEAGRAPILINGKTEYQPTVHPQTVVTVDLMNTTVRCTERDCGAILDETMWRRAVAMIEAEHAARAQR